MDLHLKEDCRKRSILCEYCSCDIVAEVYPNHLGVCSMVMVSCENKCGKEIPRKNLQEHLSTECSKRLLVCEYCRTEMEAETIDQHHSSCTKHLTDCPLSRGTIVARENMKEHLDEECVKNVRSVFL